ncbi:4'-phosphopantetheinyl transferase superfamily protein [Arthrobacter sp. B0490]|uniref:4'-phosphopantetheinyl transferase family protein n=1 Tax=Arthrobacter sp. B0490 TaxID=2058891 RepID=UPI000CE4367D|nr:4'-phosphopantetheinyl transferase superfamily protein [Arthrobacter sp. B0490]
MKVRELVAIRLGVDERRVVADFECPACRAVFDGSHGWPRYRVDQKKAVPAVSFSRAGDWLVVGMTKRVIPARPDELLPSMGGSLRIGVDVEDSREPAFADEGLDSVMASAGEAQALRRYEPSERPRLRAMLWTRKEAAFKAVGLGLRLDPQDLDTGPFTSPRIRRWPAAAASEPRFSLADAGAEDLGLPLPFVVAVAVREENSSPAYPATS